MRVVGVLSIVLLFCGLICGCGGSRRHDITTGGQGSLAFVRTVPIDGESNVSTITWVRVYWPEGTEPPPTFRFDIRDGSDTRIATKMHEGDGYEWYFEPDSDLDPSTRYKIEIYSGDDEVECIFFTDDGEEASLSRAAEPKEGIGPAITPALPEHLVIVNK
jgi:hypothetical protein